MSRTLVQIFHRLRAISQRLAPPEIAVIGGYHGGNLGDMALGQAVLNQLPDKKTGGLQTIYNLDRWPKAKSAIVGGGAVGYSSVLQRLVSRFGDMPHRVAFAGVDFNEANYSPTIIEFLKKSAWISCRSSAQAKKLSSFVDREIFAFPDLAFSLNRELCEHARKVPITDRQKKFLINVVPLYGTVRSNQLVPSLQYRDEWPELFESFERMQDSYRKLVRETVSLALDEGYRVETIPFTPADEEWGKILLGTLPVNHTRYSPSPVSALRRMISCRWVFTTRFHATIFALKAGCMISPLAYALKNEHLLNDVGASKNSFLTVSQLASGNSRLHPPITPSHPVIENLEKLSEEGIRMAVSAIA